MSNKPDRVHNPDVYCLALDGIRNCLRNIERMARENGGMLPSHRFQTESIYEQVYKLHEEMSTGKDYIK